METYETVRRLMEARTALVRDLPFFGHLAMSMKLAVAPCGTACTDGSRLIFDPTFVCRLDKEELQFLILHELLHCVLNHCTRGRSLLSELFNIACDIVVNSIILEILGTDQMKVDGEVPMHLTPDGQEGRLFSAEEVYRMLLKETPPGSSGADDNPKAALDRHDLWRGISDGARIEDQWRELTVRAAKVCGGICNLPPVLRQLLGKLSCHVRADWRQLLHDFLQVDEYDYGFLPPDRRFCYNDLFLPAYQPDEESRTAENIWVCVDTSGSVSDEELEEAVAEILDAMRQVKLQGKLSFFDTDITEPVSFAAEEDVRNSTPKSGGGTSFHVIFQRMEQMVELPRAVLIFTDGYAPWPEERDALGVPVFWLISEGGRTDAPWGTVAEMV